MSVEDIFAGTEIVVLIELEQPTLVVEDIDYVLTSDDMYIPLPPKEENEYQ